MPGTAYLASREAAKQGRPSPGVYNVVGGDGGAYPLRWSESIVKEEGGRHRRVLHHGFGSLFSIFLRVHPLNQKSGATLCAQGGNAHSLAPDF